MIQTYRTSRLFSVIPTAGGQTNIDLRDSGISGPLVKLGFRLAGTYSTSGSSTAVEDAPVPFISNIRLQGNHSSLGTVDIFNGTAKSLARLTAYLWQQEVYRLATVTSGTLRTFACYFELPLRLEDFDVPCYLDPRSFASLSLSASYDTLVNGVSSLALTSAASPASLTLDIFGTEILPQGAPGPDAPHFIPRFNTLRQPIEAANTALKSQAIGGGFIPLIMYEQYDSSAGVSAYSVDGLVNRFAVIHRGIRRFDGSWLQLKEEGGQEFNLNEATGTNKKVGSAIYDPDRKKNGAAMIDARVDPVFHEIDTSSSPQVDTAKVVNASGDLLIINAFTMIPNPAMAGELSKRGLA